LTAAAAVHAATHTLAAAIRILLGFLAAVDIAHR
jgi:hypothetical protein